MTPLSLPQDPIGAFENQALQDLSDEYRMLRLEQMIAKRRRDVEKMRSGIVDDGPLPSNQDFLQMAKFMADLSPEEAARVRNAYSFLKLSEKSGGGGMNMLPMLLNYARQNPNASEDQMIKYLSLMDGQMVKGMEMMKAANPPKQQGDPVDYMVKGMELMKGTNSGRQNDPVEFLKLVKELMVEGFRNPIMQAIKDSQPTPGVLDQLLTNPALFTQMKEIGLFGGGSKSETSSFDLEIEKLRGERALSMKKIDLDMFKSRLEMEAQDRRTDNVLAILGPIAGAFAGPAAQRMREMGYQHGSPQNPIGMPPMDTPPLDKQITIQCSCGHLGSITFEGPPPAKINCPSCGLELNVGDAPDVSGNP